MTLLLDYQLNDMKKNIEMVTVVLRHISLLKHKQQRLKNYSKKLFCFNFLEGSFVGV